MTRMKPLLSALLSAALLSLAYPPVGLGFFAWVALIPLFPLIETLSTRRVFLWTWVSGVIFYAATISWIRHITFAGMVLAVLVLAVFHALPFTLARFVRGTHPRAWLPSLPFVVAGLEWARSFDVLAFPWMIYANSQAGYPLLIQFADITSAFGVSAWVVMINAALFLLIRKRTVRRFAFAACLFLLPFGYSLAVIHSAPRAGKTLTVSLIQGNVGIDEKWSDGLVLWNIDLYRSMSFRAAAEKPDILVWPETAIPTYLLAIPHYRRMVQEVADSTGIPVLSGLPAIDPATGETWNAAGLFLPGQYDVRCYYKIHLVPFGEAFPFDEVFPALRKIEFGQANWDEGEETVVFTPPVLPPFHTAICFESIFPDLNREFVRKGSRFIAVVTNDVWFGPHSAPIQHAMISVLRAIEFHRPIVRCANTGISMIIDPYGRIGRRTGTFERTILTGAITPRSDLTFYARFGNVFSQGCALFSLVMAGLSVVRRRNSTGDV